MRRLSEHLRFISVLETRLEDFADSMEKQLATFGPVKRASISTWADARSQLTPFKSSLPTRFILLARGDWVQIVTNSPALGHDAKNASRPLKCRGITVETAADVRRFYLFQSGENVRVVHVLDDGDRWDFYSQGPVQPYERVECYEKRRKAERLTSDMVLEYLHAAGAAAFPVEWAALPRLEGVVLERSVHTLLSPLRDIEAKLDV